MSDSQGESGGAWPLIGRDHEIGEIEAAYRRPAVHGVMLLGARGAGKSRVAREAAARLTTGGRRILWIGGRRALRSTAFGAVARLVPGAYDELAMVSRLASDLRAAGPDRPIIVVDDAHLLDDASAAVLAELAARHSVFLIGTVPSGECAPKAFAGLRNSGRIVSLPIGPLSLNAMERLVARAFGTGMDAISRRRLGPHHTSAVHFQERADSLAQHREGARTALLDRWWLPVPAHPAPGGGRAAGLPFDDPADRRAWG